VNLRHLYFAAQAVAPKMRARGGGVIINLGSISWHLGLPDLSLYETAKAGIEGMTRALARELGVDGVRVVCIVPGNVQTPRQMKWYTPEGEAEIVAAQCLDGRIMPVDVDALAMFLASDDAAMVTGNVLEVDGGVTAETARLCVDAGATALVAGTAVFRGGPDAYAANIAALRG
jgi:NAD(P)-dependent dehydrogenase (short-subunit alcohol dehydrogenase family)